MIWVSNIATLWANRKRADEPCYCDPVVYPNDVILQHRLNTNATSGFTCEVYVYSSNGATAYSGNVVSYFSFYVALDPYGNKYFSLRCEQFAPEMCENECYILRVKVLQSSILIFDKYTEIYCQNVCCDVPRGISISTDDTPPELLPDVDPVVHFKCSAALIRIRSVFECVDNETGYFYGLPETVLQGTANFTFEKIYNFPGKIKNDVSELEVVTSFHCKTQRTEKTKIYTVQGNSIYSILPDWKRDELENMLMASYIEVNDFGKRFGTKQYLFGTNNTEPAHPCWDMFLINFTLQDCTFRNDYGCGDCGVISAQSFLIPENANGNFYTENKQPIGDLADLKDYYESLGFNVTDQSFDNTYAAFQVSGSGVIPYFYYNSTYQRNKVYGTPTPVAPVIACQMFELGMISSIESVCADFELGMVYSDTPTVTSVNISDYGSWEGTGTSEITDTTGKLNLTTTNVTVTETDPLVGEAIGVIDLPGRPRFGQAIDLGGGKQIIISTDGIITFYGEPDSTDPGSITLTDVYYSL